MLDFEITDSGNIRLKSAFNQSVWFASGITMQVTVPPGFESDGASIPAPFWWLVGPPIRSNHLVPAVVHDFLCDNARDRNERLIGDAIFRKLLAEHKVPAWKQMVFWFGVYLQGRFLWKPKMTVFVLLIAMIGAALIGSAAPPQPLPEPHIVIGSCQIDRVIDADTADLSITRIVRVRFRDCWAPETHKTKHPSEKHLGLLAEQHLKSLIGTETACRLEILPDGDEDIGDGLTFGRVVGNVYLERGDGRSLNEIMNASGLTFPTKAQLEAYLDAKDAEAVQ